MPSKLLNAATCLVFGRCFYCFWSITHLHLVCEGAERLLALGTCARVTCRVRGRGLELHVIGDCTELQYYTAGKIDTS